MAIINVGRVGFHKGEKTLADAEEKAMDQDIIQIEEKSVSIPDITYLKAGVTIQGDPTKAAPILVTPPRKRVALLIPANIPQGMTITLKHLRIQVDESVVGLRSNANGVHLVLDDVQFYHKKDCSVGYNSLLIDSGGTADVEIKNSLIDKLSISVNTLRVQDSNFGDYYWQDMSKILLNQGAFVGTALQSIQIAGLSKEAQAQVSNSALGGDVKFNQINVMGDTDTLCQLPIINHRGKSNLKDVDKQGATSLAIGNDAKISLKNISQGPELDPQKLNTKLPLPKWRTIALLAGSLKISQAYLSSTTLKNVARGGDLTFENVTDDGQWVTGNKWGAGPKLHLSNKNSKSEIFDQQEGLNSIPTGINGTKPQKTALQKLDEMIGLKPVKAQVKRIVAQAKAAAEREKRGLGNSKLKRRLGMIFAGNAGSGKTTVAKYVAQALYEAGVLSSSKFNNVGAADLVSQYVGKTAQQTHDVILKSLDGVLLIDEAYALNSNPNGGNSNNFSQDAITQLVKDMDNYSSRLVVIAAGYSQPMKQFLANNQGLSSRFPYWIEFPDYSPTELKLIMRLDLKKAGARLARPQVIQDLDRGIDTLLPIVSRGTSGSGNGRFVDNYVQSITQARDFRLSQGDMSKLSDLQLMIIQPQDVQAAVNELRTQQQNMG